MAGADWLDWWKAASQKKCSDTLPARSWLLVKTGNFSAHPRTSAVARKIASATAAPEASGQMVVPFENRLRNKWLVTGSRSELRSGPANEPPHCRFLPPAWVQVMRIVFDTLRSLPARWFPDDRGRFGRQRRPLPDRYACDTNKPLLQPQTNQPCSRSGKAKDFFAISLLVRSFANESLPLDTSSERGSR